jgi:putative heme-binding domain-containing protein
LFFSRANGSHLAHVMMPEKFLAHGRVPKATSEKSIEDHQKVFPQLADKRPEYAEGITQFTNASGCMIYQGGAWPRRYQNSAFICEPTVHLLHEDMITPVVEESAGKSIGYEAIKAQKNEFLTASDLWFRPITARYGPDGAMYLLDFYNPAGFHSHVGATAVSDRPDQDYAHGRIWRIQHRLPQKFPVPPLVDATNLVKALEHPNAWVRMTAQRLLIERGETNVTKALSLLVASNRVAYVRVHALWTLQGLQTLRETNLFLGIADHHPGVQKNALRILTERTAPWSTNLEKLVLAKSKEGADDRAKLNGLFALQQGRLSKETHGSVLRHFSEQKDVWSKSAYLGVAMTAPMEFIKEALATDKGDHLREAVAALGDHLAETGSLSNAVYLVERMARLGDKGGATTLQGALLDSFTRAESPDFIPAWTTDLEEAFQKLLDNKSTTIRYNALALANRWDKEHVLAEESTKARKRLLEDLRNHKKDDERNRIITAVMSIPSIHAEMIPFLEKLFSSNTAPAVVNHLVKECGRSSDKAVAAVLIDHFPELNAEGRQLALSVVFKRPEWVSLLIDALADKEIHLKDLGVEAVSRLHYHPDPILAKRATEVIESLQGPLQTNKDELIAKFMPALSKPDNHQNGSEMYRRYCGACHRLGERDKDRDKTKDIGPELNPIGVYGPEALLTHILDPNRACETNYIAFYITTKKQENFYGEIISENKETIKVRNLLGDADVRVADIVSKKSTGRSLMPEGWEALGTNTIRDIVAYIIDKGPKGYRTVDLTSAFTADSRKGLFSEQGDKPSLDFKKFGLFSIDNVPFNVANPDALSIGKNLIVLKGGSGFAKSLPQRVEFPVGSKASRIHVLGGVAGWGFPNAGNTNDPLVRAEIIYKDKETEEVLFHNGNEFADYIKRIDVPGSRYVPDLVTDGQLRLFSFQPKRTNEISRIILESFDGPAAPTFVAMTAQLGEK